MFGRGPTRRRLGLSMELPDNVTTNEMIRDKRDRTKHPVSGDALFYFLFRPSNQDERQAVEEIKDKIREKEVPEDIDVDEILFYEWEGGVDESESDCDDICRTVFQDHLPVPAETVNFIDRQTLTDKKVLICGRAVEGKPTIMGRMPARTATITGCVVVGGQSGLNDCLNDYKGGELLLDISRS